MSKKLFSENTHTHKSKQYEFQARVSFYLFLFKNASALNLFHAILSCSMRPIFHLSCWTWTKDVHIHITLEDNAEY